MGGDIEEHSQTTTNSTLGWKSFVFRISEFHGHQKKKKIVIHVPIHKKIEKHVHTVYKHIHHHHKPVVIKEEKVVHQEHHPIVHEEHIHHHEEEHEHYPLHEEKEPIIEEEHIHHHHNYDHIIKDEHI
ncbi:histidine-rich glycoprotein-like [Teleopsis dalmanni]|uniref:histidine-rich glycoprotein-like n=1 Tax=Teleopsis dalmanni TaxID=139649 RepID=UPI0018CF39D3|nr:histidine-rich glycoprotein-like [Teleopsis dalmanni]